MDLLIYAAVLGVGIVLGAVACWLLATKAASPPPW